MVIRNIDTILSLLCDANYRRSKRRIDVGDVRSVVKDAWRCGVSYRSGGWVANAYKYPATTVAVAACRVHDSVYLKLGVHNARKSSSEVTWFGPLSCRPTHIHDWVQGVMENPDRMLSGWHQLEKGVVPVED